MKVALPRNLRSVFGCQCDQRLPLLACHVRVFVVRSFKLPGTGLFIFDRTVGCRPVRVDIPEYVSHVSNVSAPIKRLLFGYYSSTITLKCQTITFYCSSSEGKTSGKGKSEPLFYYLCRYPWGELHNQELEKYSRPLYSNRNRQLHEHKSSFHDDHACSMCRTVGNLQLVQAIVLI